MMRLERTFRSSQELSTLAGDFVMKNPNQLTKKVRSDRSHPTPVELALVDTDAGVTLRRTARSFVASCDGEHAPLGWDVKDPVPAAQACVALLSDWFPATTGEIVHVDGGYHATGF